MKRIIGRLRHNIKKQTKDDLIKLEKDLNIKISPSAKKVINSSISWVFRPNSKDLRRAGRVERVKISAKYKRDNPYKSFLIEDIDVAKKTQESIAAVVKIATKFAQEDGTRLVSEEHFDMAISSKWCRTWPFCNKKTSRKLGLKVKRGKLNE